MSSVKDIQARAAPSAPSDEAAQPPTWSDPRQGVIEEAQRRQRRRRRRLSQIALATPALIVLALALIEGATATHPRAHSDGAGAGAALSSAGAASFNVRLAPSLEVGQAGWQVFYEDHGAQLGGEGIGPALESNPIIASWGGGSGGSHQWTTLLLTTPNVAATLVEGRSRVPTVALPGLPYGYRAARILTAISPAEGLIGRGLASGPQGPRSLVALNAKGEPIRGKASNRTPFQGAVHVWEYPDRTAEGSCGLRASGLAGLSAQGGRALSGVRPYPAREIGAQIVGHAFLPCVSVTYHLRGMPLRALILLDAAHPGARAAALPDFKPVSGAPGFVQQGGLTARREGAAWLVVGQGSSGSERVALLRHLRAIVRLGSLVPASSGVPEIGQADAPPPPSRPVALRVAPALEAGALGWEYIASEGDRGASGSCCSLLAHAAQLASDSKVLGPGSGPWWWATVITAPQVAAVSVEGRAPVPTHAGGLPYGMRQASVVVKHFTAALIAFNSHGRRITKAGFETLPKRRIFEGPYAPRSWSAGSAPPAAAACRLSASGLSGLSALGGAVVLHLKGYQAFESRAFQSCADTYYSLGGSTLQAAVLLDAQHPGSRPAALPGMKPIAEVPGVFEAPGGIMHNPGLARRQLAAKRLPGAWLVVADGRNRAQQLQLLAHLSASIRP